MILFVIVVGESGCSFYFLFTETVLQEPNDQCMSWYIREFLLALVWQFVSGRYSVVQLSSTTPGIYRMVFGFWGSFVLV